MFKKTTTVVSLKERSQKVLKRTIKDIEDLEKINQEIDLEIKNQNSIKKELLEKITNIDSRVDSLKEQSEENSIFSENLKNLFKKKQ